MWGFAKPLKSSFGRVIVLSFWNYGFLICLFRVVNSSCFSQYPRSAVEGLGRVMGCPTRSDTRRYVEWRKRDGTEIVGRDLYDHRVDLGEDQNIASNPANREIVTRMSHPLADGWQANRPPG